MPISGTFNGTSIVALPSSPAPQTIEFNAFDTVVMSVSPFTGQQQTYDWQSSWLEASVSMPPLTHVQAQTWIAFLLQLRGQANLFQIGDPLATAPRGSALGTPLVDGDNQHGYTLATKGWTANTLNVLMAGDWVQIGYRLYRVLENANAGTTGRAILSIWPQLRAEHTGTLDGTAIVTSNARGLFRLKSNARKWSITEMRLYGIQFDAREAL